MIIINVKKKTFSPNLCLSDSLFNFCDNCVIMNYQEHLDIKINDTNIIMFLYYITFSRLDMNTHCFYI